MRAHLVLIILNELGKMRGLLSILSFFSLRV